MIDTENIAKKLTDYAFEEPGYGELYSLILTTINTLMYKSLIDGATECQNNIQDIKNKIDSRRKLELKSQLDKIETLILKNKRDNNAP